jgi:hypothetical protein
MNGRNFAHGVDFGTFGWYKARIRGGAKLLILLWLQEGADNPFLGTIRCESPQSNIIPMRFAPAASTTARRGASVRGRSAPAAARRPSPSCRCASKAARDRKRATGLKVEGRKTYREIDDAKHGGKTIALAKRLRRRTPKSGRRSLRAVADELARAGYKSESGKPYAPTAIGRMLGEIG